MFLLLLAAAGLLIFTQKTSASPPVEPVEPTVPTADVIAVAPNLPWLDYYYELSVAALVEGQIDATEYQALYDAYAARYWELSA